jgi:hypothetical protein
MRFSQFFLKIIKKLELCACPIDMDSIRGGGGGGGKSTMKKKKKNMLQAIKKGGKKGAMRV